MSTPKSIPKPAAPQGLALADLRFVWKTGPITAPVDRQMTGADAGLTDFIETLYGEPGADWDWRWIGDIRSLEQDLKALASLLSDQAAEGGLDDATTRIVHQFVALLAARCSFEATRVSRAVQAYRVYHDVPDAAA